jgi:hypothetical protein
MPTVTIPEKVLDRLQRYMGASWTNVPDAITSLIDQLEEYEDCDGTRDRDPEPTSRFDDWD